jgi:hypothetical protein
MKTPIQKLNSRLASIFGRNPHGEPNYIWAHAAELFYLFETGMKEMKTESGLIVMRTQWQEHSFVETYGLVWLMAKWTPPELDYDEWWEQFQGDIPFPAKGQYCPIESTVLPEGRVPDEALNQYAIRKLYEHLGMSYRDHLDASRAVIANKQRHEQRIVDDSVDDAVPAFGNIPGKKEHVSFPTPTRTGGVLCQR